MVSPVRAVLRNLLASEAGRREPGRTLARFAGWQLWRRVLRRPLHFRSVTGPRLRLLPGASDSISGFWYLRLPDFAELAFILHCIRPGELFVDVGANQGGWTLTVAGRGARVLAFEPIPLTRERLAANVAANPPEIADRVTVRACALGESAAEVEFTTGHDATNHRVYGGGPGTGTTVRVPVETADAALRGLLPVAMKIDVEGEELNVLRGAGQVLAEPSLAALVLETFRPMHHGSDRLVAIEALLARHGFRPFDYDPWHRALRPLAAPEDGGQNTIYVRDPAAVAERLRTAPPIRVFGRAV